MHVINAFIRRSCAGIQLAGWGAARGRLLGNPARRGALDISQETSMRSAALIFATVALVTAVPQFASAAPVANSPAIKAATQATSGVEKVWDNNCYGGNGGDSTLSVGG